MTTAELENNNEEWKEVWDQSQLRTVAAFYNTDGGTLVIGRKDDGSYAGVPDPKDTVKKISDTIRNKLRISVKVHIGSVDGANYIQIDVPAGNRIIPLDGHFYIRMGNTNHMIEGEELKTVLLNERGTAWLDQGCNITYSDLSKEAVHYFIENGKSHGRIDSRADESDLERIVSAYDLKSDGKLTLTAGIAFSERPRSLDDGAFLKIGKFDTEKVLRREDYIEVPGILIPSKTLQILNDRYTPPSFIYDDANAVRRTVYDYPENAVRELIVNAIVHKDYRVHEPVTVAVYDDHLEISCIGGLPKGWTANNLLKDHKSIRRNRTLANLFHDAGLMENWGQGIKRVIESCKSNGNPPPRFEVHTDALYAIVYKSDRTSPSKYRTTEKLENMDKQIVGLMLMSPRISASEIARIIGVSSRTVERHIAALEMKEMVHREGNVKSGVWVVNSTVPDNLRQSPTCSRQP